MLYKNDTLLAASPRWILH